MWYVCSGAATRISIGVIYESIISIDNSFHLLTKKIILLIHQLNIEPRIKSYQHQYMVENKKSLQIPKGSKYLHVHHVCITILLLSTVVWSCLLTYIKTQLQIILMLDDTNFSQIKFAFKLHFDLSLYFLISTCFKQLWWLL